MKISELAKTLDYEIITPNFDDNEIKSAYTSDLLSDVLGNAEEEGVLITIQAHKNTIAVAFQVSAVAVLICNGKEISPDMVESAEREGIAILRTEENQFVSSYKIHKALFG